MEASPPFNDCPSQHNNEDYMVIRTKNKYDFHVYRPFVFFSEGSFFSNLIKDAQVSERKNGLPVATLEEDSEVIDPLLRLCYPGKLPSINIFEHFSEVLNAARKYCLESDLFLERVEEILMSSPFMKSQPERVYVLGVQRRMKGVCLEAAKRSVEMTRTLPQKLPYFGDEVKEITGSELLSLLDYREKATRVVARFVEMILEQDHVDSDDWDNAWLHLEPLPFDTSFESNRYRELGHSKDCIEGFISGPTVFAVVYPPDDLPFVHAVQAPIWWQDFLLDIARNYQAHPHRSAFTDPDIIRKAIARATDWCSKCEKDALNLSLRIRDWAESEFMELVQTWVKEREILKLTLEF
ncbi:hypothetical protein GYMLUDRAFT_51173 [Collybiopsis luxurians FD-317 M1]|uniref:BTB domain-containing protein n=1 Tax=Collybiopsis luxurians FD-317 M1 TaxID=944289 RepID=A0A0D0C6Y3_9AGAR|nr:hypothetical protein GYMLUDRAFT_51173 [Collybiopsis luxurians FD-317 M1]